MKQGEEGTEFVKHPEKDTSKYIFQKNKKTKIGALIVIVFLILIIAGIVLSGVLIN